MSRGDPQRIDQGADRAHDIWVAISGRQHSDQLTAALVEGGYDAVLHHAMPIRSELETILTGRHHHHAWLGFTYRASNRLLSDGAAERLSYPINSAFDRFVAYRLRRKPPRAVVVYENGALNTLRAAKALGLPTILDAASVHHRLQATAGLRDAGTTFRAAVDRRKDAEIALADHILTCSTLARDSYVAAGVPEDRIAVVPLGFEPGAFGAAPDQAGHTGRLRIAFVGRFTRTKGADLLGAALAKLTEGAIDYECRIAASQADGESALSEALSRHATLLGKLPHAALADLYRWADVLVQPSRFDSFGLVVPEALACGLPVIASDRVGACDFIEPGVNGFIVKSGDTDALATLLRDMALDPAPVRAMRPAALAASRGAEWSVYRRRAADTVREMLGWSGASQQ